MKELALIRIAAAAGVALSLCAPAMAAEEDGVTCGAGTTAQQNANNTNLTCYTQSVETRPSGCVSIGNGLQQVVRPGPDQCTDPSSGANAGAPTPVLLPGDPTSGWVRQDKADGRDVFVQTIRDYDFPRGASYDRDHNRAKGVSCPSGFRNGGSINNGRGIRCETEQRVAADCDALSNFQVDHNGRNRDACIGVNGVGKTKPKGITNVEYQTQLGRWKEVVQDGRDEFRHFGFPTSSR